MSVVVIGTSLMILTLIISMVIIMRSKSPSGAVSLPWEYTLRRDRMTETTLSAEPGYEILYQTNRREIDQAEITFDRPIPTWLKGKLIRNGPGIFENGPRSTRHVFDGFGKVASWELQGNQTVLFSTKFIQSKLYQDSILKDTIAAFLLMYGVEPEFSEEEKLLCLLRMIDNMNVNVVSLGKRSQKENRLAALNDISDLYEISLSNLSTVRLVKPSQKGCFSCLSSDVETTLKDAENDDKKIHVYSDYDGDNTLKAASGVLKAYAEDGGVLIENPEMEGLLKKPIDLGRIKFNDDDRKFINKLGGSDGAISKDYRSSSSNGESIRLRSSLFSRQALSSSHPLPEPGTENLLTFMATIPMLPWEEQEIALVRMTSINNREIIAQWKVGKRMPYMHSFSVTQSKVVFLASPWFTGSVGCMLKTAMPMACLEWHGDQPMTLYIVDIKTGNVSNVTIAPPSFTVFHHINAYEVSSDIIIMDVASYPSGDIAKNFLLSVVRDPAKRNARSVHAAMKRITIHLAQKIATVSPIDHEGRPPSLASFLDFPVINEAYRSRPYCYVYGLVLKADNVTYSNTAIVKKDVCNNGTEDRKYHEEGTYQLEPWFVARPGAVTEDDGVLLVQSHDGILELATVTVLNATSFEVISRVVAPIYIPFSFHGRFFSESTD